MADPLSEDAVVAAIAQHIGRPDQVAQLRAGADISFVPMLNLRIVRSTVSRGTRKKREAGRVDLSDRRTYEGEVYAHLVEPPKDPATRQTTKLVQRDSVKTVPCTCEEGRRPCLRCSESGQLPCVAGSKCQECQGVSPCSWCDGTGKRRTSRSEKPARNKPDDRGGAHATRTTCVLCRKAGTACPTCRGQGFKNCLKCDGKGSTDCPGCGGKGSKKHDDCHGTGVYTVWTEGRVTYKPRRDSLRLPKPRPTPRVLHRTARSGAWGRVTLSAAGDTLPDGPDAAYLKEIDAALEPGEDEVARRAEISWLLLADVTLAGDPDHRFFVFPGREGAEVVAVWSRTRTLRVAAATATALALLVLLLALFA
jgi:hypothetical protein